MRQNFVAILAAAFAFACGSEKKPGAQGAESPPPTAVNVQPSEVRLRPSDAQQFSLSPLTVQVSWSITESNGGSINQTGMYTAPRLSGIFHVVATSTANTAVSGSATVTVDSGVRIVAPSPVSAYACEAVQLSATVSGSGDTGVAWSVPSDCGAITAAGVFTSLRGTGTCTATAIAHADAAQLATVTINVAPERVLSVAVVPASITLAPGGGSTFAANVTTACGTFPAGL